MPSSTSSPAFSREFGIGDDAQAGDHDVGLDLLAALGRDAVAGGRRDLLLGENRHALLPVVVVDRRRELRGEQPRPDPGIGEDHRHRAAVQRERGRDLRADEATAHDGSAYAVTGDLPESPVVVERPVVDDVCTGRRPAVAECRRSRAGSSRTCASSRRRPWPNARPGRPTRCAGPRGCRRPSSGVPRKTELSSLPVQRPLERGGRAYGSCCSAPKRPMLPSASWSRIPRAAASPVMPPPTIRYR